MTQNIIVPAYSAEEEYNVFGNFSGCDRDTVLNTALVLTEVNGQVIIAIPVKAFQAFCELGATFEDFEDDDPKEDDSEDCEHDGSEPEEGR